VKGSSFSLKLMERDLLADNQPPQISSAPLEEFGKYCSPVTI
jgi:hypothetical protein